MAQSGRPQMLGRCHGFVVTLADGGYAGVVETPVFAGAEGLPDHLLIRTTQSVAGTFRFVPAAFVSAVDDFQRTVTLELVGDDLATFPEELPLALR